MPDILFALSALRLANVQLLQLSPKSGDASPPNGSRDRVQNWPGAGVGTGWRRAGAVLVFCSGGGSELQGAAGRIE